MYIKDANRFVDKEDYYLMQVQYKDIWYDFCIDKEDYEKVKNRHWRVSHKRNKVYAVSGSKAKNNVVYLHNYILNYSHISGYEVAHIDGNHFNNRKENLRIVDRLTNIQNVSARIDNKIGIRGVTYHANWHSYTVDFSFNKNRYYFPHWKTIEEAVYCRKTCEEHFGLSMLNHNPLAQQYLNLPTERIKEIENITIEILRK